MTETVEQKIEARIVLLTSEQDEAKKLLEELREKSEGLNEGMEKASSELEDKGDELWQVKREIESLELEIKEGSRAQEEGPFEPRLGGKGFIMDHPNFSEKEDKEDDKDELSKPPKEQLEQLAELQEKKVTLEAEISGFQARLKSFEEEKQKMKTQTTKLKNQLEMAGVRLELLGVLKKVDEFKDQAKEFAPEIEIVKKFVAEQVLYYTGLIFGIAPDNVGEYFRSHVEKISEMQARSINMDYTNLKKQDSISDELAQAIILVRASKSDGGCVQLTKGLAEVCPKVVESCSNLFQKVLPLIMARKMAGGFSNLGGVSQILAGLK